MRKILFVLIMILLLSPLLWSEGQQEGQQQTTEPDKLVLMIGTPDFPLSGYANFYHDYIGPQFTKETGIPVEVLDKGSADGTTQKIDLMLSSGEQVDVFADYMGRVSKYMSADYAVDLAKLFPASYFDRFYPSLLAQYKTGNAIYALPDSAWVTEMVINKTLADRVGMSYLYERPDRNWSMDEFTTYVKAVSELGPDYYGTEFFAKQSTGDYRLLTFLACFGASNFDAGGHVIADSPQMIKGFQYILNLQDHGWTVTGGAGIDNPEYVRRWATGKIGAAIGDYTFVGMHTDEWSNAIMEPPRVTGRTASPVIMGNDGVIVFKGATGRQKAGKLAQFLVSDEIQNYRCDAQYRFASVPGVLGRNDDLYKTIAGVIQRNGIVNAGLTYPYYNKVRESWWPMVQSILSEEKTPEQALAQFVEDTKAYAP